MKGLKVLTLAFVFFVTSKSSLGQCWATIGSVVPQYVIENRTNCSVHIDFIEHSYYNAANVLQCSIVAVNINLPAHVPGNPYPNWTWLSTTVTPSENLRLHINATPTSSAMDADRQIGFQQFQYPISCNAQFVYCDYADGPGIVGGLFYIHF